MKPKTLILMFVAVSCGLVAAYLANMYTSGPAPVETIPILVAAKDLPAGTVLKEAEIRSLLTFKAYPKELLPTGALENSEDEVKKMTNKVLARSIGANMPLTMKDMSSIDLIMREVPPGYQAITLKLSPEALGQGFIMPGAMVDLIVAGVDPKRQNVRRAWTFLQNIRVLAINTTSEMPKDTPVILAPGSVTLAVKPHDAKKISVAEGLGQIRLALRKPGDDKIEKFADESLFDPDVREGDASAGSKTVKVMVAREKLEPGTMIEDVDKMFVATSFPVDLVPGALTEDKKDSIKGLRVRHPIAQNFPITADQFVRLNEPAPPSREDVHVLRITEGGKKSVTRTFRNGKLVEDGSSAPPSGGVDVNTTTPSPTPDKGSEAPLPGGK